MAEDLLAKEKGFRQLNKQLEKKTHDLISKINFVINNYSSDCSVLNLSKDQGNTMKEDNTKISFKRNSSLPHIFDQFSTCQSKVESQKDVQNEGLKKKSLANETIINLFQTKMDVLLNELQAVRAEYKKQCDVCKKLESENRNYEIKLQTETGSLKETIAKLDSTVKELECQSQTLNSENLNLKKDLDKLEKQIKVMNQESSNQIMRLNRSLENNDKLKSVLKNFKVEEKELKTEIKKLQEDRRLTVHSLGKQFSEVVQILKRQTMIVDNLKRQTACLAAVGQLKFTKEDFSRLLDEKPETLR